MARLLRISDVLCEGGGLAAGPKDRQAEDGSLHIPGAIRYSAAMNDHASRRVREGLDHQRAGRLAEAEALYRQVLAAFPRHPDALHLLAVVLHRQGRRDEARQAFDAAAMQADIESRGSAIILYNRALLLADLGDDDRAAEDLARAADLDPGLSEAAYNLGLIRQRQGRLEEAEKAYRRALLAAPANGAAWTNLGAALADLGRPDEAVAALHRATAFDPASAEACSCLAQALRAGGRAAEAVAWDYRAVRIAPERPALWQNLANALADGDCAELPSPTLATLLARNDVEVRGAAMAASRRLAARADILRLAERDDPTSDDPLLLALLAHAVVRDAAVERAMTAARRRMLLEGGGSLAFRIALAHQCFLNEYVWDETAYETVAIENLGLSLEEAPEDGMALALYAAYRPLHKLKVAALGGPELAELIRRQVVEPADERRRRVPALTPLDIGSDPVRAQYEENPFPRWRVAPHGTPRPFAAVLRGLLPGVNGIPESSAPDILIAGCGTGRQAVMCARRYAGARILAIDLSRASLAHAIRQAEAQGHGDILFAQADILRLGSLDRRFDLIESFGVLHHMDDAAAGLGVLRGLLKPGGLMMLGLYSARAREDVMAVRRRCAGTGGPAGDLASIRRLRRELLAEGDRWSGIRGADGSFWSASECRDLLFHVRERCFTLPEIGTLLAGQGLEFLTMEIERPADMHAFRQMFPDDPQGRSLAHWDAFERRFPRTFANTYRFWARRT
ncbi:MAG: tetratricopeptide repeat protein [Magnetospirillum sp. WYHS-4]